MNELVNYGIKFSKLEINTGFINGLPKKWLSFCQSLRNTNHVKDYVLASLFGKLKYEETLIDSIYENKKEKTLVSSTPLSTAFFSTYIVQDFQDSPDDEENTRNSQEYLNDLEKEYQERALLAKSKIFFKKGTQRFNSAKATDQTECRICDLRPTKDFKAKYNKAKDRSPDHPSAPTPVVAEMHKEAQQAAGGPTSLGATSEEGAYPQLSSGMSVFINIEPVHSASFTFHSESASKNDVSADFIAEADLGKSAPNGSIPHQQGINEGTTNYAPGHTFVGTNLSVLVDQTKSARDGLKTAHINLGTNKESRSDDISKKIKLEDLLDLMKDTRSAFFNPDYPTDEPITVTDESKEEKAEKHEEAHFASNNETEDTSASHPLSPKSVQLQELKDQELPAEFLVLPSQVSLVHTKLQTLDTLLSLLNKVANTLTRFANITENASHIAKSKGVPSAGPTTASLAEKEKNTNPTAKDAESKNLHDELVDLLGIDIVTQYYNKKLLYDKYYDKMLKRRKSSKIINCDVLTQKSPITLQVYRENGTIKVIPNIKVSDLHLAE
ncbi:hypothetical protein Tco_0129432 [Tanacetum coccineum]